MCVEVRRPSPRADDKPPRDERPRPSFTDSSRARARPVVSGKDCSSRFFRRFFPFAGAHTMSRIAHLSDVHMLDPHTKRSGARYRFAAKAVSLGRPIDPRSRAKKLARGLAAAKASGAEHVVISGDLTELGDAVEFEHFAEVLEEARIAPENVTLVPGNHDAYTTPQAWRRALSGPLARYAASSADEPGKVVERARVAFLPIDTSCFQTIARSGGEFTRSAADAVEKRLADRGLRDKAVVLVLHHPPFPKHHNPVWQWIDALRGSTHVLDILKRHPRVQLMHGHLHRVVDRIVGGLEHMVAGAAAKARIFGAPAIVDDDQDKPRVRLYDVRDGQLESAGLFT
jgi:3',5'-cyclic AMP phosphodiesterase CpdA